MREKNERPDQKKTKKKKNKTAIDCRCLYLLTYKFNTIKNIGLFMYSTYRRFFLQ